MVIAEAAERYDIGKALQQQLWFNVITKGDFTQSSLAAFMRQIGKRLEADRSSGGSGDGVLFQLDIQATVIVEEFTSAAQDRRRASRGLQWLLRSLDILQEFPDLHAIIRDRGADILNEIKQAEADDAAALSAIL